MLKLVKILSTLLLCTFISTQTYAGMFSDNPINYVFIQSADSAILKPNHKNGMYTLTLKNAQPYIHYVSERPKRITGVMTTSKFFKNWEQKNKNSFAKDAPNVSITGVEIHSFYKSAPTMLMMELTNPHYNPKKNEITYDAKSLGANPLPLKSGTIKFKHTVLFIDSGWCPSCCCG